MSGQGYQLVIECQLDDGSLKRLYLDTCTEKRVNATATLPQQPLQDGRVISDHMYSNPDEYSISGSFSLYGNIHDEYDDFPEVGASTDRLTNIQNVFEYIKDNGLLCNLTTINTDLDGSVRFKIRESMALKSISWTEKQASMSYSLSFVEVLTVDILEEYAKIDEDLPEITLPEARSLGSVLIEEENGQGDAISKIVIAALYERGYIPNADISWFGKIGYALRDTLEGVGYAAISVLLGALAKVIVEALAIKLISITGTALSTVFPVGTIIGVGLGIIVGIWSFLKITKNRRKEKMMLNLVDGLKPYTTTNKDGSVTIDIEAAKQDKNVRINNEEMTKLMQIIAACKTEILKLNEDCKLYTISSSENDNEDREVALDINGNTYFISFVKNENAAYGWDYKVAYANALFEAETLDGTNGLLFSKNAIVSDLDDADINKNCLFTDKSGEYFVFIYNPSISLEDNKSEEAQKAVASKLYSYQVLVSKGPVKPHIEAIYDAVYSKLESLKYVE